MKKLLLATYNRNKKQELAILLKDTKSVKVIDLEDLEVPPPAVIEDGRTFRENAVKKAVLVSRFFDGAVLADDSGLEVDALGGKPGVRSARFARIKATDAENVEKLLKLLRNTPAHRRTATFVCCLALAKDGHLLDTFDGTVSGRIMFEPKGKNGFGYDPVFMPLGKKKTFAQMKPEEKNRISHRFKALEKFKKSVAKYF